MSQYKNIDDVGILASEVGLIGEAISELIGVVNPEVVLGDIFMNFCIGK
jgi:tRNA U34 5-carboxymethylaminomethyl modifying GTPase MnmE/TrmE